MLHLAVATDRAYLPYAATTVLSALEASAPLAVHLLHGADVAAAELARFGRMVAAHGGDLRPVPVPADRLGDLPPGVAAHGGAVSCARLVLPDLLDDVDRLVYLDADTLVLAPLDHLAAVELDGAPLGAVRNVLADDARERVRALGADPDRYLNSGVLVMDLARMRAEGTARALARCLQERGDTLLWVDQDALNVVLGDRWAELPARWNAQNSFWDWPDLAARVLGSEQRADAVAHPAVLHFEGPWLCKPWHYLSAHEHTSRYREVLRRTPFGDVPLADRTPATRLIRRLPEDRRTAAFLRLLRLRRRLHRRLHRRR